MSAPKSSLAQQATVRELVALVDGPCSQFWYWRNDLEAQQAAARDMQARGAAAELGVKCHYRPTEQWVPSLLEPDVFGRAWTYDPPPFRTAPESPAESSAPVRPPCAVCEQPLLLLRPGRSVCERCRLDQRFAPVAEERPPKPAAAAPPTATAHLTR